MRQQNINGTAGTWIVEYPEQNVWLYDSNVIVISSANNVDTVGAEIIVTDVARNATRTLRYIGDMPSIVFSLDDTLLNMYHGNMSWQVSVTIYRQGNIDAEFGFTFTLLNGKSYPNRTHGAERTLYHYSPETLRKVQIWAEEPATLTLNGYTFSLVQGYNALDLRSVLPVCGEYTAKSSDGYTYLQAEITNVSDLTPDSCVVNISSRMVGNSRRSEGKNMGGVWKTDTFNSGSYSLNIIYNCVCWDNDMMLFHYINADGFDRYIMGKILEETVSAEKSEYQRLNTQYPYRNLPYNHQTGNSNSVKVGFEDIRRDAYLMDICVSPLVEYLNVDGVWMPCTFEDSEVTVTSNETQDYEMTFCLNRE